ncbi:MAG: hypothetical protein K2F77_08850, partial [Muribaculaceae bacterium]|nr:hypothetical protein [Muribaculaceae bacterium]
MKRLLLYSLVFLSFAILAEAQRTTRRGSTRTAAATAVIQSGHQPAADTIVSGADSCVRLSGFDKTLASRRESFFVSNLMDSADLVWLSMRIDYLDMSGRQLHQRRARVRYDVPPGQTRRVDIPSWDIQKVYYYHKSEPRRRVMAAAA